MVKQTLAQVDIFTEKCPSFLLFRGRKFVFGPVVNLVYRVLAPYLRLIFN